MIPVNMVQPTYTLTLPSNGKIIKYRPFVEFERKIMLMALETKNKEDYLIAIKQIIEACCSIDIDTLALFDLEYIFIQLRAKSIGEVVKLNFRCDHVVDLTNGNFCNNIMHPEVDITTAEVIGIQKDTKIKLSPIMGVKMKYPSVNSVVSSKFVSTSREFFYEVLSNCIEYIWEGENIYYTRDYPMEDVVEFITKLTVDQFDKLEIFISDLPVVRKVFTHKCGKCHFEHTITLEGYQSFFI